MSQHPISRLEKQLKNSLGVLGEHVPRRDDKLANAIENKGLNEMADILRMLYS
jgi:hypothetical protein